MYVQGVTEVEVKSTEEAYAMFWKGTTFAANVNPCQTGMRVDKREFARKCSLLSRSNEHKSCVRIG